MAAPVEVIFFDLGDTLVASGGTFVSGAEALLADLAARGVRLGIISNTGDWTREQLSAHLPPAFPWGRFEPGLVVLSSEVHVEKPNPTIFRLAVLRAGVAATQCLYCSESLLEALAAQAAGLLAARIQPPPHSELGELLNGLMKSALLPAHEQPSPVPLWSLPAADRSRRRRFAS